MIARLLLELARQRAAMRWDAARIARHQDDLLPRVVRAAYETVAGYRARFDAAGVNPADIRSVADLSRLPYLPKPDYRRLPLADRLVRGTDPARCRKTRTSGTSGIPIEVIMNRRESAQRHAAWMLAQRAVGMPILARRLVIGAARTYAFRGGLARLRRQSTVDEAVAAIRAFQPAVLNGYPSQLLLLLERYRAAGEAPPPIRMIYSGGEMLDPPLRTELEAFFRAPVADLYGTWEIGVVALPCPAGGFHLFGPSLILECARDGRPVPAGEEGELLLTDLRDRAMPLIRYAIGDRVVLPAEPCGCRTAYRRFILRDARKDDLLHALDGRRVGPMSLGLALTHDPAIRRYRITERAVGDLLIELELEAPLAAATRATVESAFRRGLGDIRLEWAEVASIPPHPSGKERRIVSLVGRQDP